MKLLLDKIRENYILIRKKFLMLIKYYQKSIYILNLVKFNQVFFFSFILPNSKTGDKEFVKLLTSPFH